MSLESLKALQNLAQSELLEENERKNKRGDQVPIVYPIQNGTMRLKLLYKDEAGIIQKKLIRHTIGKDKVPCMSMYGEDCPICKAIRDVEDQFGKDCGAYQKYGFKTRGISYAMLVDFDAGMFKGVDDPKKGDLILFMYPPSLYNDINNIIVKSGEYIESLVAKNEGKTIEITRSQKNGGYPDYTINVYAYGDEKIKETEDEWQDLIAKLPNLKDAMSPANPTDELRDKVRAAVETISADYANNNVINPNDTSDKPDNNDSSSQKIVEDEEPKQSVKIEDNKEGQAQDSKSEESEVVSTRPTCFGNHSDLDSKCLVCPDECDCLLKS